MKKICKKFLVLLCSMMLCLVPTVSVYAASIPILVIDYPPDGIRSYVFNPAAIEAVDGQSTALYDTSTSDQTFPVSSGKSFQLQIICNANDTLQITIFGKTLYYNETITTSNGSIIINLPANSYNDNYHVWLNAKNHNATLEGYTTIII